MIISSWLWSGEDSDQEFGRTLSHLPRGGVAKALPLGYHDFFLELKKEWRDFGIVCNTIIPEQNDSVSSVIARMIQTQNPDGVYLHSIRSSSPIQRELEALGIKVLVSKENSWESKPFSKEYFVRQFGLESTPRGEICTPEEILAELPKVRQRYSLVKKRGMGGRGNLLLEGTKDLDIEQWLRQDQQSNPLVLLEEYVPWKSSGGCSFFIEENGSISHSAVTDQILSPVLSYRGSRSSSLSGQDQEELKEMARKVGGDLFRTGVRGWANFDFIILREEAHKGGISLSSGMRCMLIEINPRSGGSSQDLQCLRTVESVKGDLRYARLNIEHLVSRREGNRFLEEKLSIPPITLWKEEQSGFFLEGHGPKLANCDGIFLFSSQGDLEIDALIDRLVELRIIR